MTTTLTHYEYADGSANHYTLTGTTLDYRPIRPEESSTGMYSGGEPKTVTLTQAQVDTLRTLLDRAISNTAVHMQDRIKGSGAIYIFTGKESLRYILVPGCKEITIIEGALKKCLE